MVGIKAVQRHQRGDVSWTGSFQLFDEQKSPTPDMEACNTGSFGSVDLGTSRNSGLLISGASSQNELVERALHRIAPSLRHTVQGKGIHYPWHSSISDQYAIHMFFSL
jgi:hypothetical protein